jgi:hypothetical protein
MKTNYKSIKRAVAVFAAASFLIISGCSKDNEVSGPAQEPNNSEFTERQITDPKEQRFIDDMVDRLPSIAVYHESTDRYITLDLSNAKNGFNWTSADASFSFSGPSGTYQFVQGPDGSFYQVVTPGSSGGGGGAGGVVTAGDVTLAVNYVFCFNSGDDFFGLDLFDVGSGFTGFSGLVGIAGNFEELAMMSESEIEDLDPFEIFQGFVAYYVFDGTPDGDYEIIDFFNAEGETDDFLEGKGIAFLISFQDGGGIFFSSEGTLTFSGGSVGFEGMYLGLTDFLIGFGDGGENTEEDADYVEVEGFGTLNCQ